MQMSNNLKLISMNISAFMIENGLDILNADTNAIYISISRKGRSDDELRNIVMQFKIQYTLMHMQYLFENKINVFADFKVKYKIID